MSIGSALVFFRARIGCCCPSCGRCSTRLAQAISEYWPAGSSRRRTSRNCRRPGLPRYSSRERRSPRSSNISSKRRNMPEPGFIGATPSALMPQAARAYAGKTALRYGEQSWTFAEFDAAADRLASGLTRRVAHGERVVVLMANRPEYVLLQCAIERAGLVRVPINARSTAHELGIILADCEPAVLSYDQTTADRVTAAEGVEGLWHVQVDGDVANGGPSY